MKRQKALLAVTNGGSTCKRSVQDLHTGSVFDTAASGADKKRRKTASTPATVANTLPLPAFTKQPFAELVTTTQPMSQNLQSAPQQFLLLLLCMTSLGDDLAEHMLQILIWVMRAKLQI